MSFPLHTPLIPLRSQTNELLESFGDRGPIILDIPGGRNELLMAGSCTITIPKLYPIVGFRKELPGIALPGPIPLDLPRISFRKVEKIESNIQATEFEHCEEFPSQKQAFITPPCPAPPPGIKKIFDVKEPEKKTGHPQGAKPSGSLLEDKETKEAPIALSTTVFYLKGMIDAENAKKNEIARKTLPETTQIVPVLSSTSPKKVVATLKAQCEKVIATQKVRDVLPMSNKNLPVNKHCIEEGLYKSLQKFAESYHSRKIKQTYAFTFLSRKQGSAPVGLPVCRNTEFESEPIKGEEKLSTGCFVIMWNSKCEKIIGAAVPAVREQSHWRWKPKETKPTPEPIDSNPGSKLPDAKK